MVMYNIVIHPYPSSCQDYLLSDLDFAHLRPLLSSYPYFLAPPSSFIWRLISYFSCPLRT